MEDPNLSEESLAIIYTCGTWSNQGGRFFVGIARDKYGTRHTMAVCFVLVVIGILGIGFSNPNDTTSLSIALFLVGFGSGILLCFQPISGLFPNKAGTVLSSLSGAFQLSGLIFMGLAACDSIPRQTIYLAFAICIGILGVGAIVLCPKGGSFIVAYCWSRYFDM